MAALRGEVFPRFPRFPTGEYARRLHDVRDHPERHAYELLAEARYGRLPGNSRPPPGYDPEPSRSSIRTQPDKRLISART